MSLFGQILCAAGVLVAFLIVVGWCLCRIAADSDRRLELFGREQEP